MLGNSERNQFGNSEQDTYKAESMIQLGILAVLPYLAELVLERGIVNATLNLLHQLFAGSLTFFIAR
jgi:hypothetical protein